MFPDQLRTHKDIMDMPALSWARVQPQRWILVREHADSLKAPCRA